ncbi:MAG: hypothetical protein RQ751_06505 [Longimicrobiales bacterium]|nr:hypothetical protein [Longimicrobiales bacterium]
MRIRTLRTLVPVGTLLVAAALAPAPGLGPDAAHAQDARPGPTRQAAGELPPDSVEESRVSPGGAFLRAVLLPTWGHAAIGSHRRGIFYLVAEGGTAWMLFRSGSRKNAADRVLGAREAVVRDRVALEPPPPEETPLEFEARVQAALDADPEVQDARRRVDAREGQMEDWIAMGIFLTLLSGVDAFVTAHLQDFPDPIDVNVGPTRTGGVQVEARFYPGALFR